MKAAFLVAAFLLLSYCAAAEIGGASGTFASESKSVSIIRANETAPFVYRHGSDLGIYEIRLTVNKDVRAGRIDIQKTMAGADVPLPVNPRNGTVYKVLYVGKSGINDSSIEAAEIRFMVPKYWIRFHKINPETMTLARLNRKNWTGLETEKFAEDGSYLYFRAEVRNFSIYSIYGRKGRAQNISLQSAIHAANSTVSNESIKEEKAAAVRSTEQPLKVYFLPARKEEKYPVNAAPAIIAILLMGSGIILYVLSSRRLKVWRIRMKLKRMVRK